MDIGGMGGAGRNVAQNKIVEALQKEGASTPAGPSAKPEANDVERFREAYNRKPETEAPANPAVDAAKPAAESDAIGDRILRGLGKVSDDVKAGRDEMVKVMDKEEVSQADLLRAGFAMMKSTTLVSAVGKTSEKITQGVKTMQQG